MNNYVEHVRDTVDSNIPTTIVSLQQRFEAVRRSEIDRMRRRLGNLSRDQKNAIDSLTKSIISKVLDAPMTILKLAPAQSDSVALIDLVHRIFDLGDTSERTQPITQIK